MPIAAVQKPVDAPPEWKRALFALQVEQHQHDEVYHREIARLPIHQRLQHMALHFAKYTGRIATMHSDSPAILKVLIDAFVIVLSSANVLNLNLGESVGLDTDRGKDLRALGTTLAERETSDLQDDATFLRELARAGGRIAGACEKVDHLEDYPFRREIVAGVERMATLVLIYTARQGADLASLVRERLAGVKERLKLHGHI